MLSEDDQDNFACHLNANNERRGGRQNTVGKIFSLAYHGTDANGTKSNNEQPNFLGALSTIFRKFRRGAILMYEILAKIKSYPRLTAFDLVGGVHNSFF
jgi:hypothetical protein